MIGRAAKHLSVATIKPLHSIFSALGVHYIGYLPVNLLNTLQDEMQALVRRLSLEEHLANLLCLAVLAKLSSIAPPLDGRPSILKEQNVTSAPHFFTAKHAQKTLNLIVLKTISICSGSSIMSLEMSLDCLKLIDEIAGAVEPAERQAWFAGNLGKTRKLYEKVLRSDIDQELRCAALNVLATFIGDQPIPGELMPTFEDKLLAPGVLALSPAAIPKILRQANSNQVTQIMKAIMSIACNNESLSRLSLTEIDNASFLFNAFISIVEQSPSFGDVLLDPALNEDFLLAMDQTISYTPANICTPTMHSPHDPCPRQVIEGLHRTREKATALLLRCALLSRQRPNAKCQPYLLRLLEVQSKSSATVPSCEASLKPSTTLCTRISLIDAQGKPRDGSVSHGWKETLIEQMSRDFSSRYEAIIATVGNVCRDLELRCNEVERPLREEQERSTNLQSQVDGYQDLVLKLSDEVQSRMSTIEESKAENDHLHKQLNSKEGRLKDVSSRLEGIQEEFKKAIVEAQRAAEAAAESSRERDLAYLATLKSRDKMYEKQTTELATARTRMAASEADRNEASEQVTEKAEQIRDMASTIVGLRTKLADIEATTTVKDSEIASLKQSQQRSMTEKDEAGSIAREASSRKDSAIATLQSNLESAKSETVDLQLKFDDFVRSTEAERNKLELSHGAIIIKLSEKAAEEARRMSKAEEENRLALANLQRMNARLRKDHVKRTKEFAEAEKLSRKLMAVVGIQSPLASPSAEVVKHDQHCRPEEIESTMSSKGFENTPANSASFGSGSSSQSNGPTPKRTKTQRSLLARRAREPIHVITSKTPARTSLRASRQPLGDVLTAQNRRFTIAGVSYHKKEIFAPIDPSSGILEGAVDDQPLQSDESFGGDDLFTSTDQKQLSALKSKDLRHTHEDNEMTTDF